MPKLTKRDKELKENMDGYLESIAGAGRIYLNFPF